MITRLLPTLRLAVCQDCGRRFFVEATDDQFECPSNRDHAVNATRVHDQKNSIILYGSKDPFAL